jgi:hypothetical protein
MWLVVALLAAGRFLEFFMRSDSADRALGLEAAQWTSLAILAVAAGGAWLTLARTPASRGRSLPAAPPPRERRP